MIAAVTGGEGFIGKFLLQELERCQIPFVIVDRAAWSDPETLRNSIPENSKVVHLAGLSRHTDGNLLYQQNMILAEKLAAAAENKNCRIFLASSPHVLFKDLPYHRSKRDAVKVFEAHDIPVSALYMPNTFGPGSKPFYNSVVSTFAALAAEGKTPPEINPVMLELIPVRDLCRQIVRHLDSNDGEIHIPHTLEIALPELWEKMLHPSENDPVGELLTEVVAYFKQKMTDHYID